HLPFIPHPIQLPRIQPRRQLLQNHRVVHQHLLMPRRFPRARRPLCTHHRARDVPEEGHLLGSRAREERGFRVLRYGEVGGAGGGGGGARGEDCGGGGGGGGGGGEGVRVGVGDFDGRGGFARGGFAAAGSCGDGFGGGF